jgi:localization factor PodJL
LSLDPFYNPGAPTWLQPTASDEPSSAPVNDSRLSADAPQPGKGAMLFDPASSRNATMLPGEAALGPGAMSGVLNDFAMSARDTVSVPSGQRTSAAPVAAIAPAVAPDATGSLTRGTSSGMLQRRDASAPPEPTAAQEPAQNPASALPATIGSKTLIAAAGSGDAGASYEVASRFAEGRNVPQDLPTAALWFERAARSGMAPAQFRLGSMYEKGLGLKKDLQEARRLYLSAADRGSAKAMHNLAVLYAEGIDGKPDYAAAAQWFRKAAGYGLVDSEYNLAILYARGVGVERNLADSYKWFALAAKGGDEDAGKKRDDIAGRLDPQQLARAKQAADAFIPERQPEEATATKAPPGGWDEVTAPPPVSAPPQVTTPTSSKPRIARQRAG